MLNLFLYAKRRSLNILMYFKIKFGLIFFRANPTRTFLCEFQLGGINKTEYKGKLLMILLMIQEISLSILASE